MSTYDGVSFRRFSIHLGYCHRRRLRVRLSISPVATLIADSTHSPGRIQDIRAVDWIIPPAARIS